MGVTNTSGKNAGNDRKRFEAQEWHVRAIKLRRDGFTIAEIAARVGRSATAVGDCIREARVAVPVEDVLALREQQQGEIAKLKRKYRKLAITGEGDVRAGELYLKVLAREAKLLGLDAPEKTEVSGSIDVNETPSTEKARDIMRRMFGDVTPEAKPKPDEPKSDPGEPTQA